MRELGDRPDVASLDLRGRNVLLAAREEDLRQPLVAATVEVGEVLVRLDRARDDLEVADPAELVTACAEDECLGRLPRVAFGGRRQPPHRRHPCPYPGQLRPPPTHSAPHLSPLD